MTGISLSSADLDDRRKRMLFRAWRRGTREMDLLLGGFAESALAGMDDSEMALFEHLLDAPDKDMYAWITGKADVPINYDSAVYRALKDHSSRARDL
jgi:antitoxin CptB